MTRMISLTMCLLLPVTAFAEGPLPESAPPVVEASAPPAADQPANAALVPNEAVAPTGATEGTRACGMAWGKGCCSGGGARKGKWIFITGVVGTIVTAAAVGIAVGVATSGPNNGQVR